MEENKVNNTVNAENENKNVNQDPVQEQPKQAEAPAKPVKELETLRLGRLHMDVSPTTAKWVRRIGKGLLFVGVAAAGVATGTAVSNKKTMGMVKSKNSEIDRLTAELAAAQAPKLVDTIASSAEAVVETIPDIVDTVAETVD